MTDYSPFLDSLCSHQLAIWDDFLPADQFLALMQLSQNLYQQQQFKPAKIGRGHQQQSNQQIRNDHILWLDTKSPGPASFYLSALMELMQALNRELFLSLVEIESHFAMYAPGSFYHKHRDQFQGVEERQISLVYYLNNQWGPQDGGALLVYPAESKSVQRIDPIGNRLVCFRSHLEHEVLPTQKQRASITAWFKNRKTLIPVL